MTNFESNMNDDDVFEVTETSKGYILTEGRNTVTIRVAARLVGCSCVLAGLGLFIIPIAVSWTAQVGLSLLLMVLGALVATRAGVKTRAELEIDLQTCTLRKRRREDQETSHIVAQFPFEAISGFDVDGTGRRAALIMEIENKRRAILTGSYDALQAAAHRIGMDVLRARQTGVPAE